MVQANLADVTWEKRTWAGSTAYAESKVYDVLLAFAIARRWRDVLSNALEYPREWAGQVRWMISTKPTSRRHGWPSAITRLPS